MNRLSFLVAVAALAATVGTAKSQSFFDDAPMTLPHLNRDVVVVKEFEIDFGLPQGAIAQVDDTTLTEAHLLEELLRGNLSTIAQVLLDAKLVELEMTREKVEVSPEEQSQQLDEMLPRIAPGKTLQEVVDSRLYSRAYLDRMARMNMGWKKLFWKARNITEEQRANQANQFLMQIYMNEVKGRYQLAIRGKRPSPPKGALAALNTIINGKRHTYTVTPREAMEFLVGLLRPASIIRGQDLMIENFLIRREMQKAGIRVSDTEVEGWVREMRTKYTGPFNWDMILKVKGTTPDAERLRWKNVQAWKRSQKVEITNEDVDTFREKNIDYFRSRHVKVRHILVKTTDAMTGLEGGDDVVAAAKEKIERLHQLASEGVDFEQLAKQYSDDDSSKASGGKITQPVKKWGGGYDPAFQEAAYKLKKGELSKPVKTAFGYHLIYCDEEVAATARDIDWTDPRYAEWVLEEYESIKMEEWKQALLDNAKITKSPKDKLLAIKEVKFPKDEMPEN